MHTRRTSIAAIAALLVVAVAAGGCSKKSGSSGSGSSGKTGGKSYKIAFVPKLQGIPYFEAMNAGGKTAQKALGNITWLYQGPTTADAAGQAQIVRSYIQQKVDALVVAPNDPNSMAPVLAQAKAAGIKVLTSDTDAPDSVRQAFVSQASTTGIGEALTDQLMKAMGGKGEYAIVSCGETAENLNSWIAVQKKYAAKKYPGAKLDALVYAGENQSKATSMASNLLSAHPKLKGLVGECTSSAPGVAQAVKDAGKIGKVVTVGLGTPLSMKPYLQSGAASASVLWDVQQLGYLTAWAGAQLAEGKSFAATNKVDAQLPAVKWDPKAKTLLLGDPLIITKANAGKYHY
ncbi:MAG: autoinducer 2 ABC transporter substrate-binding protein [Mycobacteriales bacterium]